MSEEHFKEKSEREHPTEARLGRKDGKYNHLRLIRTLGTGFIVIVQYPRPFLSCGNFLQKQLVNASLLSWPRKRVVF